jgi:dihydrofolate reductase
LKIILLAAVASNRVIGINNSLPWDYPEDLKKFKEITSGDDKVLLMGRKTYDSLPVGKTSGEKLHGRKLMVISNTFRYAQGNAVFNTDIDASLDFLASQVGIKEVYVIGGATIYNYFIENNQANEMMITEISKPFNGNIYFPKYNQSHWQQLEKTPLNKDCNFVHYRLKS